MTERPTDSTVVIMKVCPSLYQRDVSDRGNGIIYGRQAGLGLGWGSLLLEIYSELVIACFACNLKMFARCDPHTNRLAD